MGGAEVGGGVSNAMSHSALAAGEGDRERRQRGREYFCMLYEARRHMPSEPGCLLSQGSWFDRPVLAPAAPPPARPTSVPPSTPLTNALLPPGLLRLQ